MELTFLLNWVGAILLFNHLLIADPKDFLIKPLSFSLQDPEKELIDEGPPPASQIPLVKNAIKLKLK